MIVEKYMTYFLENNKMQASDWFFSEASFKYLNVGDTIYRGVGTLYLESDSHGSKVWL